MDTIFKLLKSWLVVNWKTTVLGIVAGVEIYQKTGSVEGAIGAALAGIMASDAKTTHADGKTVSTSLPSAGVIMAVILAGLAFLMAPNLARADDTSKGLGCSQTKLGELCAMPTIYVGMYRTDLKTGDTDTAASPGAGIEFRLNPGTWKEIGMGPVFSIDPDGQAAPGASLSFLNYGALALTAPFKGFDRQYKFGHADLFLGLGLSF